MSTIFKCNSSNSAILNKNKQVSHSKQETISSILTNASPNLCAPPKLAWQYNVTNLT